MLKKDGKENKGELFLTLNEITGDILSEVVYMERSKERR